MSGYALRVAEALTRSWVGVYTGGMPPERRILRRVEIESDLWEHAQTARAERQGPFETAREVFGRLVRGTPADLLWRFQKGGWEMQSTFAIERTTGVIMLLIILLGAASFVGGHSTGSGEPYFTNDFPTFARNLGNHTRQLIFQFALATTLLPAAALLYLTFRPQRRGIAAAGALALVTSSVLFFARCCCRRAPPHTCGSLERRRNPAR